MPTRKNKPTFAEELTPFFERHGAKKIAALCGVTPRTVYNWLGGKTPVPAATKVGVLCLLRGLES